VVALSAIVLSITIYLGFQSQGAATSLDAQVKQAISIDIALGNGKPTLTEFYANWCSSCQAMAKDLALIKQKYAQSVNFVMLNVDNNKWLPEVLKYRVDGIPHFVFFDAAGTAIAQVIGEQPLPILDANLAALIAKTDLPYANATGQTSLFEPTVRASENSDPRRHGVQTP
jgi:thiol-disulfide isomerase/thioredoxin